MNSKSKYTGIIASVTALILSAAMAFGLAALYPELYAKSQEYSAPVYDTAFYRYNMTMTVLSSYYDVRSMTDGSDPREIFFSDALRDIEAQKALFEAESGIKYEKYKENYDSRDELFHLSPDLEKQALRIRNTEDSMENAIDNFFVNCEYEADDNAHNEYEKLSYYAEDKISGRFSANFDNAKSRIVDCDKLLSEYPYIAVVDYDENGNYSLDIMTKDNDDSLFSRSVTEALGSVKSYAKNFFSVNPDFRTDITLRNMRFYLMVPDSALTAYAEEISPSSFARAGFSTLFFICLGAAALIGLMASLLSSAGSGPVFRIIPVEIWLLFDFDIIISTGFLLNLASYTSSGAMERLIMNTLPIAEGYSLILTYALNIIVFTAVFFIAACSFMSLGKVFTMGFGAFMRERSLIARIILYIGRTAKKSMAFLADISPDTKGEKKIFIILLINAVLSALICCLWFWGIPLMLIYNIVLGIFIIKKYRRTLCEYSAVTEVAESMAEGVLDTPVPEAEGTFALLMSDLSHVQSGFKKAVDREVRSQSMKTELITNVSHDLKTPLTAIITYADLLRDPQLTEEQRREYIETLNMKGARLKSLIDDLFEVSKASSRDVTPDLEELDLCALINQTRVELDDKLRESGIDFRFSIPDEKVKVMLDGSRTSRIFENLLVNITKYSLPGTRAYVELEVREGRAEAVLKNISKNELGNNVSDLSERFVRGDSARSTEGSGLGLAIAKSFTELQGGIFRISTDGDLFKVFLSWPVIKDIEPSEVCTEDDKGQNVN